MNIPYDVIHVGLHKCASTYLQRIGFAAHPDINLVWKTHYKLFNSFFSYDLDFNQATFLDKINNHPDTGTETDKINVFSNESLSGEMFTGKGVRQNYDLLRTIFGEIKVLLVLRNQYDMIYSLWNQYVREGGTLSLRQFLTMPGSPTRPNRKTANIFTKLQYHTYVKYLIDKFGSENVKICIFEDLKLNHDLFIEEIYKFIGVDSTFKPENVTFKGGYGYGYANLFRLANRLTYTNHNQAGLFPYDIHYYKRRFFEFMNHYMKSKKKKNVRDILSGTVIRQFMDSNRKVQRLLSVDLEERGWDV